MRSCEEFELLASLALDGEATEEERAALADHLEICPACRAYFEDIRAIHASFAPEEITLPAGFADGVMERVRATAQDPPVKTVSPPRWRRWVPGAALAACCALAVLGAWQLGIPRSASQSTVAADCAAPASAEPAESAPDRGEAANQAKAAPAGAGAPAEWEGAVDEGAQLDEAPADDAEAVGAIPADTPADREAEAPAAVAPAMVPPAVQGAQYGADSAEPAAGETVLLTTASPVAAAWVEEYLGLAWSADEVYRLTEEAYGSLHAALAEAGEAFSEEVLGSSGGVWLVRAQAAENP